MDGLQSAVPYAVCCHVFIYFSEPGKVVARTARTARTHRYNPQKTAVFCVLASVLAVSLARTARTIAVNCHFFSV